MEKAELALIIFAWALAGALTLMFAVAGLTVLVNRVMEEEIATRETRTNRNSEQRN